MKRRTHAAAALLWALFAVLGLAGPAQAQGVVTGAISGRVTSPEGEGLAGAQVTIRNTSIGLTRAVVTGQDGRYRVASLPVGGPYSVSASQVGRSTAQQGGLQVGLGQDLRVDMILAEQAVILEELTVSAEANPVLSAENKGLSTQIGEEAIENLPTLNRNFTDFVRLAPQVSATGPGLSGGGVNNRFNNIQIDGASENDLFGLGTTGQPGGQAGGKSIAIESVKEYQILLSPFDVRQGNFAGLLVNAVTKSGTNELDGSLYYYTRNQDLTREQDYITNYEQTQYGFSVGGPIIRDRLHFFVNPEWQERTTPAAGPFFGQTGDNVTPISVTQAQVDEFQEILAGYGIEAGDEGQVNNDNPLTNVFARLDLQLPEFDSRFVIRHNYGRAEDDNFLRSSSLYSLTSNAYFFESTKNSTVAQLFTTLTPDLYNELIVGYSTIRDSRTPTVRAPQISVDVGSQDLRAGGEQFSQGNTLDQDIFEITNNLSWQRGAHRIDVGTKNEFYTIDNFFAESAFGVWEFSSLANLRNGIASTYRLAANARDPRAPIPHAQFNAAQFGLYIQDQWEPNDRLSITGGIRADIPVLRDDPLYTAVVDSVYNRRTDEVPSGNVQWSPRLGFNWDVLGTGATQLRGGVGVFVGRPAFVMLGNAFQNDGTGIAFLTCGGSTGRPVPTFSADADNQPTACGNGVGLNSGIIGAVNLLDDDLKFPSTFRASLAFDHELPGGFVASLEGMYTHAVEQFFYNDLNLANRDGIGADRFGRTVFGTIAANGVATSQRVSNRFTEVIDVTNQNEDWSYNLTAGLQRQFSNGFEARAFYTFSKARDVISATSSRAISNYRFGRVLDGPHSAQNVGISSFDQPHKIVVAGTYTFPWERFATALSVIYTGQSGDPFTYVYGGTGGRGDMNADGQQGNDAIYVPNNALDATEIQFQTASFNNVSYTPAQQAAAFEEYIQSSACLREHRGRILERNTCRNKWTNFLNVSLRQSVPTLRGQALSFQVDVFNFLNLLNEDWGLVETTSSLSTLNLLTHRGQTTTDRTTAVPIVDFNPEFQQFFSNTLSSNYQIQLSARYEF
ncbi:MAG TPA: carboxypeptidase regulatory-like domain-containing protein [Longimicrobium sp.]|nr:carboxypeptidase regulatory-like domain-containing protein [Longimicrobium sp.]